MSHRPERKEKDCLNCGTIVHGKFCHVCGQENSEPKESLGGMILHFLHDLTHFDGKFFSTLGILFRKPGQLTKEYLAGRRTAYLHPVRMYVFTSAIFFLLFFTFFGPQQSRVEGSDANNITAQHFADEAYKNAKTKEDSLIITRSLRFVSGKAVDTIKQNKERRTGLQFGFSDDTKKYSSVMAYDSVQNALPSSKRHSWLRRAITRKNIALSIKYKGRENELSGDLMNRFLHMIPYLLFVSLPLYAFFLLLLYVRRRKQFLYVDHALFLLHLYIFTFMFLLIFFSLMRLKDYTGQAWLEFLEFALILYGVIYTLLAMKNFYRQRWGKTILKFIFLNILCVICLAVLFILFMGISFYQA